MAETVVINIEANTQGLQSTIDLLVKLGKVEQSVADDFKKTNEANVASLNKGVTATKKGIEDLGKAIKTIKADNTLAASLDATAPLAKTGNSLQSLGAKLKQAKTEAQELAAQFGNLDPRAIEAAKSVSELQSQINNTNKVIAAVNPDAKFNAIKNLGGAIGGIFTVATGAIQAFGVESEQATKIAQQFQGALNIFSGLSQLGQFKDALVEVKAALGITTVATEAQTLATEGMTVAEGEATVAQSALNKTILANPYVIAAAAIAALAAAVYVFVTSADDAEQAQARLNATIESSNAYYNDLAKIQSRSDQEALKNAENKIKLAEIEGKSAKEIGELKKEQARVQLAAFQNQINFNQQQIDEDKKLYDQLFKLDTEDSQKKREELAKQIADRQNANKDLVSSQKMLASDFKVLEAQISKDVAEENKKRVDDAKESRDKIKKEQIESQLLDIKKRYAEERLVASQTYKDKEALAMAESEITGKELRAQLALYNENSNEYKQIQLELIKWASAPENQIQLAPNFAERAKAAEEIAKKADQEIKPVVIPAYVQADIEKQNEARKKLEEQAKALKEEINKALENLGFDLINQLFENQIDNITNAKDAQLKALDEEDAALQKSYENRLIGKQELENGQAIATQKRVAAEKKAEQEIIALKRKQDIANRAKALFEIAINTAVNITKTPALTGLYIALGAVQAAAVLAQPLPKYKKGTLSVGGVGSEDTELALLQPGEAVIPTDTNRRYAPAIKAIYNGSIKPEDINAFVSMRLKGDIGGGGKQGVTAKMDVADLYTLGRIMKRNDGVTVKNLNELAVLLSNSHNPRR